MSVWPRRIAIMAAALLAAPASLAHARATDGTIARVAGTTPGFAGDGGLATSAQMDTPSDVAFLTDGSYVIADTRNNRIRRVGTNGIITTVAGDGDEGYAGDGGPADHAEVDQPGGVTAMSDGGYLIADTLNDVVRRVTPDGKIATVASGLNHPSDTATLPNGGFLIADTGNNRIEKVAANGAMTTLAAGSLSQPHDVSVADDGSILIADTGDNRIRRITPDGTIATVAGAGAGLSGDGDPSIQAKMSAPSSVAALPHGGFIVADTGNSRVRRITPMLTIFTAAGTTPGDSGDGGLAKAAQLDHAGAITLAPGGGFLVADTSNAQIRRVSDIGAVPPAVVGHSIAIAPGAGGVLVRPAELPGFLPLQEEDLVPNGSDVNAGLGHIEVTTAVDTGGSQITADVSASPFRMTQGTAAQPFTDFHLPSLADCGTTAKKRRAVASVASVPSKKKKKKHKKPPKPRRLFVSEKGGHWRSSTGSTSASAVGTQWQTTLSCGGTRVTVSEGIVRVHDKLRNRNVLLAAGQTTLVKTSGPNRGQ